MKRILIALTVLILSAGSASAAIDTFDVNLSGADVLSGHTMSVTGTITVDPDTTASADLELPVVRVVEGIVFDDVDVDGRRSAGEDAVAGVVVTAGEQRTVTDAGGRYRLVNDVAGDIFGSPTIADQQPYRANTDGLRLEAQSYDSGRESRR